MIVAAIDAINNPIEFSDAVNAANMVTIYNAARRQMPIIASILRILFIVRPLSLMIVVSVSSVAN